MSINWTADHLKDLEEAIAQGVRKVEYNDRTVEYMSLNDMFKARRMIRQCLGLEKRGSRVLCESSKGTC